LLRLPEYATAASQSGSRGRAAIALLPEPEAAAR
jgi:hypothetical protein